jgi:ABC-2 type transport system permease protein
MIATFRTEMVKQVRRPRTYVALGLMVLLPLIMTLAVKFGGRAERADPDTLFSLATRSGFVMPAAALLFMSRFLLVVVVAIFAGDAIAGEATWGNLRYLLVRPVSRARLLAAKLAVSLVFVLVATGLIVLTGLVAGGFAFGWHGVDVDFGFFSLHKSATQLTGELGLASLYVAIGMTSIVAMALMVSTMTDSSNGAIGAGIGLFMTSEILNAIPQLGAIRRALPTRYLDDWRRLIVRDESVGELFQGTLIQIPYVVVLLAIAFWWFQRKDVLS